MHHNFVNEIVLWCDLARYLWPAIETNPWWASLNVGCSLHKFYNFTTFEYIDGICWINIIIFSPFLWVYYHLLCQTMLLVLCSTAGFSAVLLPLFSCVLCVCLSVVCLLLLLDASILNDAHPHTHTHTHRIIVLGLSWTSRRHRHQHTHNIATDRESQESDEFWCGEVHIF